MKIRGDIAFIGSLSGVLAGIFGLIWMVCSYIALFYGIPATLEPIVELLILSTMFMDGVFLIIYGFVLVYLGFMSSSKSLTTAGIMASLFGAIIVMSSYFLSLIYEATNLFAFIGALVVTMAFMGISLIFSFLYSSLMIYYFAKMDDTLGLAGAILRNKEIIPLGN